MSNSSLVNSALLCDLRAAWRAGISMDDVLKRFVIETDARASGCWRLEQHDLRLAGFGWANDMSQAVSQAFQDATRCVSLDQVGLGIVKAAVSDLPVVGHRDPAATGLAGSATWIAKFGASSSLAVPIRQQSSKVVVGVFAVSTAAPITEGDTIWQTMLAVAEELGR